MDVDDTQVRSEAQAALDGTPPGSRPVRLATALGAVIDKRRWNNGKLDNPSLAAADHYLNMRLLTATSPVLLPVGMLMITGYDLFKRALGYLPQGIVDLLRETDSPYSPPSARDREWAFRGLKDGCGDLPWSGPMVVPFEP